MSSKLAPYGVYLQDFTSKIKQFATSTADIDQSKNKKQQSAVAVLDSNKETIREFEAVSQEIRKEGMLIFALDNYCAILPQIVKQITAHEAEDPPVSFVLKNLVTASIQAVVSLF